MRLFVDASSAGRPSQACPSKALDGKKKKEKNPPPAGALAIFQQPSEFGIRANRKNAAL